MKGHVFGKKYLLTFLGVLAIGFISVLGFSGEVHATFYVQANFSFRNSVTADTGVQDYDSTGEVSSNRTITIKNSKVTTVCGNAEYMLTYSQNAWTDTSPEAFNGNYKVYIYRDWPSGGGYKLSTTGSKPYSSGVKSSSNNFSVTRQKVSSSKYKLMGSTTYYDSTSQTSSYVNRDVYKVTFSEAGTYEFCEGIKAWNDYNGGTFSSLAETCGRITVRDADCEPTSYTLTAYAVDTDGKFNTPAGSSTITSKTVTAGLTASVTRKDYSSKGWTFLGWKTKKTGSFTSYNTSYSVSNMSSNVTVYAVYEEAEPEPNYYTLTAYAVDESGKSTTPGGSSAIASKTVEEGTSATVTRKDYSSSGWTFLGWRTSKTGSIASSNTSYTQTNMTSNKTIYAVYKEPEPQYYTLTAYAVDENGNYNTPAGSSAIASQTVAETTSATVTRITYSGWVFKGWRTSRTGSITSTSTSYKVSSMAADKTVYAVYEQEKNEEYSASLSLGASGGVTVDGIIYAKPNDNISLNTTYNPAPQQAYGKTFTNTKVNGSAGSLSDWKNNFILSITGEEATLADYAVGDTGVKNREFTRKISGNSGADIGKELVAVAEIDNNDVRVKNTPTKIQITGSSSNSTLNIITSKIASNEIKIRVPYNFQMSARLSIAESEEGGGNTIAGQDATISYFINVGKRENVTLGGSYATKVDEAKRKIIVYKGEEKDEETSSWDSEDLCGWFGLTERDDCDYSDEIKGISLEPKEEEFQGNVAIPDLPAGSSICFAVATYPSNSGGDLNTDKKGSEKWYISKSKCLTIGKKPNLQIWGGEVLFKGGATLPVVRKSGDGFEDGVKHTFGSWAELGLIASRTVRGLASGAGFGYDGGWASESYNYCNVSTLSFNNNNCNNGVGDFDKLADVNENRASAVAAALERNDKVTKTKPIDSSVGGRTLSSGAELISSEGSMAITGNIEYGGSYSALSDIPKLFIYAKNDIYIACDVEQIDAVLLAGGEVNTCADASGNSPDVDKEARSKPLRINGAIIANKLVANRTYGAGTGMDSIVPAEVINYDSTLYLWLLGNNMADAGDLEAASQSELAPRY